jgi:sugar lactone lactonase YvrE
MHAEPVTDPIAAHGEGPVWWPAWGLRWVDMLVGDVLTLDGNGSVTRRHIGDVAAAVRPRKTGGMVAALERTVALFDADDERERTLPDLWRDPGVRLNEGGCDPDGRFYVGSMAYDETPGGGTLYRVSADGTVSVVLGSVTISNGLAWSPDGATAYYNDTPTGRVDAFDYVDGELTGRRPFSTIEPPGAPDGLCVDAEGHVWVALWGGHAVVRFDPAGREVGRVTLPASHVTACAFGGPDLDRLYVTTSRKGIEAGAEPLAGALFVAEVGVRGQPTLPFSG